ncbi:MAG: sterol-binding protein [Corynebacteriales bacterium]|nr:sterol-binding protein [Mycobacteriales bacterium]
MATIEETRAALERLAAAIEKKSGSQESTLERSVSTNIPDLGTGFHGRLAEGKLQDITDGTDEDAQITLTANSDDLVALSNGELNFANAWASGKLKVDASFMDLLKLRSLL